MKSEEEIKQELTEMQECLKTENSYLAAETYGYIQALHWVLEDNNE